MSRNGRCERHKNDKGQGVEFSERGALSSAGEALGLSANMGREAGEKKFYLALGGFPPEQR